MRILPFIAALGLGLVSSGAPAAESLRDRDQARLDATLKGKTAEAPVPCISLRSVSSSNIGAGKIVYRASSKLVYVSTLGPSCPDRRDMTMISRTPGTQLCRGDIITFVDRGTGIDLGSCSLGEFTPWRRK